MSNKEVDIPQSPFRFIIFVTKGYYKWAILALTFVVIAVLSGRSVYYITKVLVDLINAWAAGDPVAPKEIWYAAAMYPVIIFLNNWLWRGSGLCGMQWITGAESNAYKNLFDYLVGHSSSFFQNRFAGALSNKISNAANGAHRLMAMTLWSFLPLILGFFSDLVLAFIAHPWIACIFIGWLIIFIAINSFAIPRLSKLNFASAEASSNLKGRIVDTSSNIGVVQQVGRIAYEQDYVSDYVERYRSKHKQAWKASELVLIVNNLLVVSFFATELFAAIYLLLNNQLSIGSVVMIISLLGGMQVSLTFISMHTTQGVSLYGQIREGLEELLHPYDIVDAERAEDLKVSSGEIRFEQVGFAYPNQERLFDGLDLVIQPGQRVGLVGPSGAGKSSLVSILLRQHDIDEGRILVDGEDIQSVTQSSLRKCIALVPQDVSLFHRTISENIRYGRLDATDEELEWAAKMAQAHKFISELPEGYKTYVGERGVKLSGGQRQRIAIARAFLRDVPILVLDEATSSLDSESEGEIQEALKELFKGRTVIAIAHRLSTLKAMDRILVMDNGKIIEDGKHSELMALKGHYARLWQTQAHGFI